MGYSLGNASKEKLVTCHSDLQKIMTLAISMSKVDFGISEGHRTVKRQKELFDAGKSKIDGIKSLGKHNLTPSEAVDIFAYHPDLETRRKLAYDRTHLGYIAGVVDAAAEILKKSGEVKHGIRWGANWDSNGVIDYDQSFDDYPHFELKVL